MLCLRHGVSMCVMHKDRKDSHEIVFANENPSSERTCPLILLPSGLTRFPISFATLPVDKVSGVTASCPNMPAAICVDVVMLAPENGRAMSGSQGLALRMLGGTCGSDGK